MTQVSRDMQEITTLHTRLHKVIRQVFNKILIDKIHKAPDISKVDMIELRVCVQSILQRVTELETSITTKDKIIDNMISKFQNLRSEHDKLQSLFEELKAEANSRFFKYDSFQKLHTNRMKQMESDVKMFMISKKNQQ
jgi:hypothetical protein